MLAFLWSTWVLLAMVEGQGPSGGGGGQPSGGQECALQITSPIYTCEDEQSKSYMDTSNVETVRHNESITYVRGEVKMMKELGKNTRLEIVLNKLANGQKEMMMTIEMELCKEIGREDSDYYNLLKYLGFPEACPIEPGTYPIHNLVADMDDLPINSGNIGEYEAVLNFWLCNDDECKEREFECCAKLDCMIEPL